jgi:Fur family ferric uptake transcriptional regulator
MTTRAHRPPVHVADLDEAFAVLRRSGGRISAPRRALLEALFASDGPVSAEELAASGTAGGRALDIASTYRSLEHLEEVGLVRHVHVGHGPGLYALATSEEHEYLACERCGRITSTPARTLEPVRERIRRTFGFEVSFSHFPIVGLCDRCAGARAARP